MIRACSLWVAVLQPPQVVFSDTLFRAMSKEMVDLGAVENEAATHRLGAQKPGLLTLILLLLPALCSVTSLEEDKTGSSTLVGPVHPPFHLSILKSSVSYFLNRTTTTKNFKIPKTPKPRHL